jgi:colanic acid/amylovoran biosynthesis glycosyltransferase
MRGVNLTVLTGLKAVPLGDGKFALTKKFIDGMGLYRDLWKGKLTAICEPSSDLSDNLDNVEMTSKAAPFDFICEPFSEELFKTIFRGPTMILTGTGVQFNRVSHLCRQSGIPCVYITENTLKTRLQIAKECQKSFLHGWWQSRWEKVQEKEQILALSRADGIQCNGTPTYEAYRALTKNPLLFFDNRIAEVMLADESRLAIKIGRFARQPIHLIFSGRLTSIKGVDDLPKVACLLRQQNIPFTMSICGEGNLITQMQREVAAFGLSELFSFRGVMDFRSELIPFVTSEADLFVCCHRQGDPSCTYVETMACGVPIVGYDNEAFNGIVRASKSGWIVKESKPQAIAEEIARLYRNPSRFEASARNALNFARNHTFEKTFRRRIDHLDAIAGGLSMQSH